MLNPGLAAGSRAPEPDIPDLTSTRSGRRRRPWPPRPPPTAWHATCFGTLIPPTWSMRKPQRGPPCPRTFRMDAPRSDEVTPAGMRGPRTAGPGGLRRARQGRPTLVCSQARSYTGKLAGWALRPYAIPPPSERLPLSGAKCVCALRYLAAGGEERVARRSRAVTERTGGRSRGK